MLRVNDVSTSLLRVGYGAPPPLPHMIRQDRQDASEPRDSCTHQPAKPANCRRHSRPFSISPRRRAAADKEHFTSTTSFPRVSGNRAALQ